MIGVSASRAVVNAAQRLPAKLFAPLTIKVSGNSFRAVRSSDKGAALAGTIDLGDLTVNRLGFGAMRLCGDYAWGRPRDREHVSRALHRAVELGVNFIDTADSYGPETNEALISLRGKRGLKALRIKQVASRRGLSHAALSLAWLLAKSPVMLPIPGTRSIEHLEDNVLAAALKLESEDFDDLERGAAA